MSEVVFYQGGNSNAFDVSASSVDASLNGVGDVLRVIYAPSGAANRAYVKAGAGVQTASTDDFPVWSPEVAYVFIGFDATHVAGLAPYGSNGQITVTRGTVR